MQHKVSLAEEKLKDPCELAASPLFVVSLSNCVLGCVQLATLARDVGPRSSRAPHERECLLVARCMTPSHTVVHFLCHAVWARRRAWALWRSSKSL